MVINTTGISGRPASLRRAHRSMALRELFIRDGISRTALTKELGLSQMATTRFIRDLIDAGLVREAGEASRDKGPGRKQTLLKLREDGLYTAGIVLTAYATEVSIVSLNLEIVGHKRVRVTDISDAEGTIRELALALLGLIDEKNIPRSRISGVSLAVSANVEPGTGVIFGQNYIGWNKADLQTPLEKMLELPVIVENIVNARALAETLTGAAKGQKDVVILNIATTIGAAIIQQGHLVRGQKFRAGRIGHFKSRKTKLTCSCGRNDCLNCNVTGWSLLNRFKLIDDIYNPAHVVRYARLVEEMLTGSKETKKFDRAFREAGSALGASIRLIDQLIEPESILLTGSVARLPYYRDGIF
ncbi:MAG: ROK family transcriptional regulator, partial [Methyloligellaceae bacterium]